MKLSNLPPSLGPVLLALLMLGGGAIATTLIAVETAALERRVARQALDAHVEPALAALRRHLSDSERLLRGAAGLLAIEPYATRMDWRNYILAVERDELPAGTNSIGFARVVTVQQLPALVDAVRLEGFPDFAVYPEGERSLYAPVLFVEPSAGRVLRGMGFDILSEPTRRAAAEGARDTGEARLSARIDLVRETEVRLPQHGAAMYFPVYEVGAQLNTVGQRRDALDGYVYVTFRLNDLLDSASAGSTRQVAFSLREAGQDGPGTPGRTLASTAVSALTDPVAAADREPPMLQAERRLDFGDRGWILHAATLPEFEARYGLRRTHDVIVAGIGITLALALLSGLLAWRGSRARQDAGDAERLCRNERDQLAACFAHVTDGLLITDAHGIVRGASAAAVRMFGMAPAELLGHGVASLMPSVTAMRETGVAVQAEGRDASGAAFPMRVMRIALPVHDGDGGGSGREASGQLWVITDLSAARSARREADEIARRYATLLGHTAFCVIAFDANGIVTDINRAGQRMLWYQPDDVIGRMRYVDFHDPDEIATRAQQLSADLGEPMLPGLDTLVAKARLGIADEQEWSYVRKNGSHLPVNLVLIGLPARDGDGGEGGEGGEGQPAGYLAIAHDLTERKRADAYISHIAHHDSLTGLPNRAQLQGRSEALLQRASQNGEKLALLLINLDRFKDLNESLGHQTGDDVLRAIGDRLKASVRQGDLVARMGADEFAVVLGNLRQDSEAELIAAKMSARLSEDLQMAGQRFRVSPSIGMALFPQDGASLADLLKSADVAVAAAKQGGRGQVRRFSSGMAEASVARFTIEGLLRRALAEEAFSMRYQPIVDIGTLRVTGVEALVTWETPERGAMSPAEFIPIAEQCGLIVQLGEWILAAACREIQSLRVQLGLDLNVAVNISPIHLRHASFPELVARCLASSGLPARSLTIEVTEGILVDGTASTIEAFQRIRELGVDLSIDDFGTGYSGLSYLTRLPIDKLKIDKSFVDEVATDEYDRAVASAIITLGHQLRLQVIAEGVETAEQFEFLQAQGCDAVQGYLFSAALPLAGLRELCVEGVALHGYRADAGAERRHS